MKKLAVLLLASLGGLAAWWAADRSLPVVPPAAVEAAPPEPSLRAGAPSSARLPPGPASLRGTEVDGELTVGADGHLLPTPGAITLFDYFLSTSGEEPSLRIRARIVAHIRANAPPIAAAEAEALLDTYLQYRERMRALTAEGTPPAELERRLQWIREERRRAFGAEVAEALFGEEERVVSLDLERRRVAGDPSLSSAERARRLEQIEARLPQPAREARDRAALPARVEREVEELRAAGAGAAEIFAARERAFGAPAARRLAALDAEREAWQERLADYRDARARIAADTSLTAEAREAKLQALLDERFDARERLRIRALEASAGDAEPPLR
jgi:lipase chaperone LimK